MKICILCDDANIAEERELAKGIGHATALSLGASKEGKAPATHWFCFLEGDEAALVKLINTKKSSIVEVMSPTQFLLKHNLKIIKQNEI